MVDVNDVIVFIPSKEQKELSEILCDSIIDMLHNLTIEEKAFVLHNLVMSFKDVSGIDVTKFNTEELKR